MESRLELQELLEDILGSRSVYYQPPENLKLSYPAIVYSIDKIDNTFANNLVYNQNYSYEITVIDKNPDSEIVKAVSKLPRISFDRHFTSDNINHTVFTLIY